MMPAAPTCPSGHDNQHGARFCAVCGSPMDTKALPALSSDAAPSEVAGPKAERKVRAAKGDSLAGAEARSRSARHWKTAALALTGIAVLATTTAILVRPSSRPEKTSRPREGAVDRSVGGGAETLPCLDDGVLVANDEGVHVRRNCEWVTLVNEPSVRAFGDGDGGVIYQPHGSSVEAPVMLTPLGLDSPIKWLPKGESEARVLHKARQGALELLALWRVDGEPNVLYRELLPGAIENQDVATVAVLARRPVRGGEATVLAEYTDLTPASWEGVITAGGSTVVSYSTRQDGWWANWLDLSGDEVGAPVPELGEYDGSESTWRPESLALVPDGRAAIVSMRRGGWDGPTDLRRYALRSGDGLARNGTGSELHPSLASLDGPALLDFDGRRAIVSKYDEAQEVMRVEVVDLESGERAPITLSGTASFISAPGR